MNTLPTHLVINAAIEKKFGAKFKLAKSAFLWGSVLPDLPFGLLSWGTLAYYHFALQQDTSSVMENVIHPAYFNNPWWIAAHNILHSPTALIIYAILLWRFVDKEGTRGHWRLHSPVSYWDRVHYADQFFWVELAINIVLLGYLFLPILIQWLTKPK